MEGIIQNPIFIILGLAILGILTALAVWVIRKSTAAKKKSLVMLDDIVIVHTKDIIDID